MRCSFLDYETKDIEWEDITDFSVLVAYQDLADARRAKGFLERMAAALSPEDSDHLPCAMWKFQENMAPLQLEIAAEQAALAHVIFIAAQERPVVPGVLADWVNLWIRKEAGYPRALVALLERPERAEERPPGIECYLREAARKGGVAFFADGRNEGANEARGANALFDGIFDQNISP